MHLRKNSSCFNEFIETFYTADEFSSPIPILARESIFSESLKKSIQILNSKALIESSYKIQHIAIEKMNKKQNFDQFYLQMTIEDSLKQMLNIRNLEMHLQEGLKIYLFTYTQDKEQALDLILKSKYYETNNLKLHRDNDIQLIEMLQNVMNSLSKTKSELYQLQRLLICVKLINFLNSMKFDMEVKYIIQSFIKNVITHFLFCFNYFHHILIAYLQINFNELIKGILGDACQNFKLMLQAYEQFFKIKTNINIKLNINKQEDLLEYYFSYEKVYLRLHHHYSLDQAALLIEYYRPFVYVKIPNQLIIQILTQLKLKQAESNTPQDPFVFIEYEQNQEKIFMEFQKFISQRYLYLEDYMWLWFLFQKLTIIRGDSQILNDQQFVCDTINYIRNNQQIQNGGTRFNQLELKIFNILLGEQNICNYFLFVLTIFDKQMYVRLLSLILYNHYKQPDNQNPELFNSFQDMIGGDLITNRIILASLYQLDQWSTEIKGKNPFLLNYQKLPKNKKKIGLAMLSLSRNIEAIYYLENHLQEKKKLFRFESGQKVNEEKLIKLLRNIQKAKDNVNITIDLHDSLKNLKFNPILLNRCLIKKQDKLNEYNELLFHKDPLNLKIYNFESLHTELNYLDVTDQLSLDLIIAQLVSDISQDHKELQLIINFLRISINLSIKSTNSLNEDNQNVLRIQNIITKIEQLLQNQFLQFDPSYPEVFWYYLYRLLNKKYKLKQKTIIYLNQFVQHLYSIQQYDVALRLCKVKHHKYLLAKLYSKQGNHFKAIDLLKVDSFDVLSQRVYQIQHISQCKPFLKHLNYLLRDGFYKQKVLQEYNSIYSQREAQPLKEYFAVKNRLSNFLFRYATQLEMDYNYMCDCINKKFYCNNVLLLFLECVRNSTKYLQESLPKIFRIWFNHIRKDLICRKIDEYLTQLSANKLMYAVELIITGVETFKIDAAAQKSICTMLSVLTLAYPNQMIWWLAPLKHFNENSPHKSKMYNDVLQTINSTERTIGQNIEALERQFVILIKLCNLKPKNLQSTQWQIEPIPQALLSEYLKSQHQLIYPSIQNLNIPSQNQLKIVSIQPQMKIAPSKDHPKKIQLVCSDTKMRSLLLKSEVSDRHSTGDTRREQRIIQMLQFLNELLKPIKLQYPLFSSLSLSQHNELIEWLDDTTTLKNLINQTITIRGKSMYTKAEWEELEKIAPKLDFILFDLYRNAHEWHAAQQNFIKTMALWSVFQYLIGFGDRHMDNILIDKQGNIIHIDYECLFHKGKSLPIPEIVDFRLTKNLRYGMGFLQEQGQFKQLILQILKILQLNSEKIIAFLDPYIYDPLLCRTSQSVVDLLKQKLEIRFIDTMVGNLIDRNKDSCVLRQMFCGWAPYL